MTQSERLRRVKEYHNSPYKEDYEREFNALCRKKPFSCYLVNLGYLFFFAAFVFWGWVMFTDNSHVLDILHELSGMFPFLDVFLILGLGIGNIILGLLYLIKSFEWKECYIEDYNKKSRKALAKKYAEKGVYRYVESDLWKYKCCEYDIDYERYICCITKKPLSRSDFAFCSSPGNCNKCKTFMGAYLGEKYVEQHLGSSNFER